MTNIKTITLSIVAITALSGCSQTMNKAAQVMNPGGEVEYSCKKGVDGGLKCKSVREVYDITTRPDYVPGSSRGNSYRRDPSYEGKNEYDGGRRRGYRSNNGSNSSRFGSLGGEPDGNRYAYSVPRPARGPLPIRTPSRVMKIWIAPWNDKNDDLHVPAYVYTEIEGRKWQLGKSHSSTKATRFHKVESKKAKQKTSKKKVNKKPATKK